MTSAIAVDSPLALTAPTLRRLDNGLTIIAEQMPVEAVNLSLWLRVGSAVESDSINGMAHFLEHMIFKGTERLGLGEFERQVEARGGLTNAATSQDYTHYYITSAPQDFATLAPLQIDLLMNPLLADDEFERERPVILEEIRRAQDNPRRRTFYRSMEMAFERLPYRRPVLGPAAVIAGLEPQQMRDFHHHWYQPDRMTAVAVGNLPVEELIQIIADGFDQALAHRQQRGPLRRNNSPVVRSAPESSFAEITRAIHLDPSLQQARLILNWRTPGLANVEETHPLDVLAAVMGRGRTSRLVQDLREQRQLVTSIGASNITYWQQGVFSISAQLPEENLAAVEAAIAAHIAQVCAEPITAAELSRIQTQVANRYVFGSETPSDRAGLYGYYHTLTGHVDQALTYPQAIQAVTPEAVQQAAQRYLSPDAYGIVTLRPTP
jgi:predicted Zn-dependent peptidase